MLTRRHFLAGSIAAAAAAAEARSAKAAEAPAASAPASGSSGRAKVYFTRDLSAAGLLKLYDLVKGGISGKVALKLHTGEPNGPNIIPREWVKDFQAKVPGTTIVECNVFYASPRQTTEGHRKTLETNGWTFSPVDIMDEDGDTPLPIKGGKWLKEVHVGSHLLSYDSMIVLTHFKGHTMGGFGGCLKNVAIGCASGKLGKWELHHEGSNDWAGGPHFMERMVEGGKAVVDHFGPKITYLSVMRRMSVDCDCVGTSAAEPTADDIGILASTDILAIDKAAIDLVYALPEAQRHDLVERIESRSGLRQLSYMRELHMGTDQYDLIEV